MTEEPWKIMHDIDRRKARQLAVDYVLWENDDNFLLSLLKVYETRHHGGAAWGVCGCHTCKEAYQLYRKWKEEE